MEREKFTKMTESCLQTLWSLQGKNSHEKEVNVKIRAERCEMSQGLDR